MHSRTTLLLAILVLLVAQTVSALVSQTPALSGQLTGPDAYMRLHRVLQLYQDGGWYDALVLRTNAPFGEQLHWTRPLDIILFAGAWIGSAVTEFPRALWIWGIVIGPATLLLLVPIWSWGTRTLLGPGAFILSLALLVMMPVLNGVFLLGRPDHHGLLALAFLSMIAIFVRLATGPSETRIALVAGVIAGAALWVSVEAMAAAAYFGAALALLWVWRGESYGRHISYYLRPSHLLLSGRPLRRDDPIVDRRAAARSVAVALLRAYIGGALVPDGDPGHHLVCGDGRRAAPPHRLGPRAPHCSAGRPGCDRDPRHGAGLSEVLPRPAGRFPVTHLRRLDGREYRGPPVLADRPSFAE
jgi:hypothetical protein